MTVKDAGNLSLTVILPKICVSFKNVGAYMLIAFLSRSVCNFDVLFVLLKESAGGDIQSPLTPESINGTDDERATPEVTQNSESRAEPTQNALPFTHRYRFHSRILIK